MLFLCATFRIFTLTLTSAVATQPTNPDWGKRFSEIRERFQARRPSFNAIVIGHPGKGKTYSLRTARKPVLVMQFDPGGTQGLDREIAKGEIMVLDYSVDDPSNPTAFRQWESDLRDMLAERFFDHIGSVALDTVTSFGQAVMAQTLKDNGRAPRAGKVQLKHSAGNVVAIPELRDYQAQMGCIRDYLGLLTGISSDLYVLGHIEEMKDEVTGRRSAGPMLTGKLTALLPALFDEYYIADVKMSSTNTPDYFFLTGPDGIYQGRTRLGSGGRLTLKEPQDWKAILKKVGRPTEDLPLHLTSNTV